MNIGIIGAENSHAANVAKLINIDKGIKGFAVTHVWGEKAEFAAKTAEAGKIPTIVGRPTDMLGKVDGVMIDHRDGRFHAAAARPFIKAGIPVFLDKPMTCSLADAKAILRLRKATGAPVCTMSSVYYNKDVPALRKRLDKIGRLRLLRFSGPGDWNCPWSGIWFYGIHQVEMMVHLLGTGATAASMSKNGKDCTAIVNYPDGLTVELTLLTDCPYRFDLHAVGHDGTVEWTMPNDPNTLGCTTRIFTTMFRTRKEPFTDERMLAPIAIMQAMERSLKHNKPVSVATV